MGPSRGPSRGVSVACPRKRRFSATATSPQSRSVVIHRQCWAIPRTHQLRAGLLWRSLLAKGSRCSALPAAHSRHSSAPSTCPCGSRCNLTCCVRPGEVLLVFRERRGLFRPGWAWGRHGRHPDGGSGGVWLRSVQEECGAGQDWPGSTKTSQDRHDDRGGDLQGDSPRCRVGRSVRVRTFPRSLRGGGSAS